MCQGVIVLASRIYIMYLYMHPENQSESLLIADQLCCCILQEMQERSLERKCRVGSSMRIPRFVMWTIQFQALGSSFVQRQPSPFVHVLWYLGISEESFSYTLGKRIFCLLVVWLSVLFPLQMRPKLSSLLSDKFFK